MNLNDLVTRYDSQGSGDFGSLRGSRTHRGRDYLVMPGQPVISFISGEIKRIAYPYSGTQEYMGVVISNGPIECKVFYIEPDFKKGRSVKIGDRIGIAQDISKRYPAKQPGGAMTPHVHVEIRMGGVIVDPGTIIHLYKSLGVI